MYVRFRVINPVVPDMVVFEREGNSSLANIYIYISISAVIRTLGDTLNFPYIRFSDYSRVFITYNYVSHIISVHTLSTVVTRYCDITKLRYREIKISPS